MPTRQIDPRIKLRHLSTFWEVARLRSVSAAAETLHISQPAVSKTLKELEDILGDALFDRSKRRLALSSAGETFFTYAAAALSALKQGIDATKNAPERSTLRIAALPTVSAHMLPAAIQAYRAIDPQTRIRIVTGPNDYLLSLLRSGDVDMVIGRMAAAEMMRGLSFEHLYSEPVVLVARPNHPLLQETDFTLAQIADYPCLMPTPDSVIRKTVDQLLLTQGISDLTGEIETISTSFARNYLRQSDAVWFISHGAVAEDIQDGYLAKLPLNSTHTDGPVGLTMRTDTMLSLAMRGFTHALREVAAAAH